MRTVLIAALPVLLIAGLAYVCLFADANALGLLGPDEPRYAAIAREMARSGDWVTPRLHGTPWFEKPVLYYWTAAACIRFFGESERAARLPSALAAVLATLTMTWLAWRNTARGAYGAALATALILPTTVAAIGFGRAATTDMLFATLLAMAMACAYEILWRPAHEPAWLWVVAWGTTLGLAVLAKGPAAVVLAGGSIAVWALAVGRWRDSLRLLHPLGIFVFLTVALPWYVLCALRHPDFVRVFFLEHNFQRYLTPVFRHEQPSWFFGPVLLLGIVPWLALLAAGVPHLLETLRVRRWAESRGLFVLCWVVFPLLFFSLSKSKLPGYILPVIPPLVLLLGRAIARAAEEQPELAARVLAAVGTTFVVIAATAGAWETKLPPDAARLAGDFALLNNWLLSVGASGAAVAILALRRRVWTALVLSSLITAGMALGILRIAARLDGTLSPRAAVATARQWNPPGQDIAAYRLHRAWHYGVNYYLQGETREWTPAMPSRTLVITSEAGLADLVARGFATAVVRRLSKQALVVLVDREQSAGGAAAQRPPATR